MGEASDLHVRKWPTAGAFLATAAAPSTVQNLFGSMGQGGFEGVQNDSSGNVWIVEDSGGPTGTTNPHAKQPNSFLFRFVPYNPSDLTKGKLQVLTVESRANPGQNITFHAGQPDRTPRRRTSRICTPTASRSGRTSSRSMTPRSTARPPSTPTRSRRPRAVHRSSDRRTVSSGRTRVPRVLLRRDRRH